jgi:hypothetical protein
MTPWKRRRKELEYLRRIADTNITVLWPFKPDRSPLSGETIIIGPMTFENLHLAVKYGGMGNPPLDQPIMGPVIIRVRLGKGSE